MRTSRHLDWREGEARGGRERRVNGREHGSMLQSASLAGMRGFSACTRASTCVWKLQGRVNNGKVALDALELARSEREMTKGGESGCPKRKNGSLPHLIISPWAAKHAGGREGADEVVGKS